MFNFFKKQPTLPEIRFTNTATGKKEVFTPIHKGKVQMYACGPTVYDHIHIGNLRAYLLPDLVKRLFSYGGYDVELTINFTDFGHLSDDGDTGEDKIMKGMKRDGYDITLENMLKFAEPFIESFKADNLTFRNLPAEHYTRASDYIQEQIELIRTLTNKGCTYETSDGLYFDVSTYPKYGVLGNVDISAIKAGARVEENPEKKHAADFALWKKTPLGWESDWGTGFPGWHTECTAMIFATLGEQIDIHTGGEDLKYTHHNAELAQAECATGHAYVNYWLHNAHVKTGEDKLAKSAGNAMTLTELHEKGISADSYRYWLLQSHYRTPTNLTDEALKAADNALNRLKRLVYVDLGGVTPAVADREYQTKALAALADDLDTPKALSLLWQLEKDGTMEPAARLATIHMFDSLLGLGLTDEPTLGREALGIVAITDLPTEIQSLITERTNARQEADYTRADELREQILAHGYEVKDTPGGVSVTKL